MTQNEAILEVLRRGDAVTPKDALDLCGSMRLAARIAELRQQGHDIKTRMVEVPARNGRKAHVAVYRLEQV